jgi:MoxR-like ATPase
MIRSLLSTRTLVSVAAVMATLLCADVASAQEAVASRSLIDLTSAFSVGLVVIGAAFGISKLASAAYEWNHARQLMAIRLAEASGEATDRGALERGIYDRRFLQSRPLLDALEGEPAVLLIDELDRADEPFEAFLLEILADFQLSIPELGTVKAAVPPVVVITSNRTREVHDAIRRRCLYHWVDYPDAARERAILKLRAPGVGDKLTAQVVAFVQAVRSADTFKPPGVAETIDWAAALSALDARELEPALVDETLGALLKYQDDIAKIRGAEAAKLVAEAKQAAG